jgi:hypothetical protein
LHCYNIVEKDQEYEDPRNFKIPEIKGENIVEGPQLETTVYAKPLKTRKVNIGIEDKPNFVNIGYY